MPLGQQLVPLSSLGRLLAPLLPEPQDREGVGHPWQAPKLHRLQTVLRQMRASNGRRQRRQQEVRVLHLLHLLAPFYVPHVHSSRLRPLNRSLFVSSRKRGHLNSPLISEKYA